MRDAALPDPEVPSSTSTSTSTLSSSAVILHVDLDAFYAQVEARRLGLDPDTPIAVQQWDGLIAVNYPAKAMGITRHMRVAEAKQKCPALTLVHVETIGDGPEGAGPNGANPRKSEQKACLARYREAKSVTGGLVFARSLVRSLAHSFARSLARPLASVEIMHVIHDELPSKATIEKASIDEVYIDVSELVDDELEASKSIDAGGIAHVFSWNSVVFGDVQLTTGDVHALRLAVGAKIASRVRGAIKTRCKFSSSAGIATNKLLAKVGSALNKPNQQTMIHPSTVPRLMQSLPLRKLGGLGGKLGSELEALILTATAATASTTTTTTTTATAAAAAEALTVGDILRVPVDAIMARLGPERGSWVLQLARGLDNSPVVEKERTKSMLAAKSFEPLDAKSDIEAIKRWLEILSSELEGRMKADLRDARRRARTLVLTFRSHSKAREQSRRCEMPRFPKNEPCRRVLSAAAMNLFRQAVAAERESGMKCTRLALTAQDFVDLPNEKASITRFFEGKREGEGGEREGQGEGEVGGTAAVSNDEFADIDPEIIRQQARLLKEASMLHRLAGGRTDPKIKPKPGQLPNPNNKRQKAKGQRDVRSFFTK